MAMEKALFAKYLVPLLNLVEHACSVGVLVKVRDCGRSAGCSKTRGTCLSMDIWLQLGFDGQDGSVSCSCGIPGKFSRR